MKGISGGRRLAYKEKKGRPQRLEPQALEITRHQTALSGVDISQGPERQGKACDVVQLERWRPRRDLNSEPNGSKPFALSN